MDLLTLFPGLNPVSLVLVAVAVVLLVSHYAPAVVDWGRSLLPAGGHTAEPLDAVIAAHKACQTAGRLDACEHLSRAVQCVLAAPGGPGDGSAKK